MCIRDRCVCVCVCVEGGDICLRDRQRHKDTGRQIQKETKTDRQTYIETVTLDRQTDRYRDKEE